MKIFRSSGSFKNLSHASGCKCVSVSVSVSSSVRSLTLILGMGGFEATVEDSSIPGLGRAFRFVVSEIVSTFESRWAYDRHDRRSNHDGHDMHVAATNTRSS